MPSLRLSNPFRRGADRPSLKQRAAALKATAAKVIRRPAVPADADPFEGRPTPAGFVPYPFDAPAGWMNVRGALKEEGERLLRIALGELDRRMDAYRAGGFDEDEVRSHETRLRRELRIDALMTLSGRMDPSDQPLPEPGSEAAMAAFHAACSEATRLMDSPINGYPELRRGDGSFWMKHSLGRALEDGTITMAEFARLHPIAAEREHRDDAALLTSNIGVLHALAYANEYPPPAEAEAAGGGPAVPGTASRPAPFAPAGLAEACEWAVRHIDWMNSRGEVQDSWTDDEGEMEWRKSDAVWTRALREPSPDLAALAGKARMLRQDWLNEDADAETKGDARKKMLFRILSDAITLSAAQTEA